MRHPLWIHRDVEMLQRLITSYTYGIALTKDRAHIQWQWENIKRDMDHLLREVDQHVASVKRDKEVSVRDPESRN